MHSSLDERAARTPFVGGVGQGRRGRAPIGQGAAPDLLPGPPALAAHLASTTCHARNPTTMKFALRD
jgi:hypothetical protein